MAQARLAERAKVERRKGAWQAEEMVRRLELGGKSGGSWDMRGMTFDGRTGLQS